MLSKIHSGALCGIEALPVEIEVNSGEKGEPKVFIVGLPDAAVKESINRVSSALANSGCPVPATKTTVNLAPGDLRKEGPIYDLPIALAMLASVGKLDDSKLSEFIIAGELSLAGELRPICGAVSLALLARSSGRRKLILPESSAREAALVEGVEVFAARNLSEIVASFEGGEPLERAEFSRPDTSERQRDGMPDFADVKGQFQVRRAVEVAVAGGHNLLMIGSPGSGKSMIAKRIPSIMPPPSMEEFLEILGIYSAAGLTRGRKTGRFERPFRAPHHTISEVGLIGGGTNPKPGEISLAHNGVLFLDELPEFHRSVLEVMRQPLEDGVVNISRSAGKITVPCRFMLVAAMNPCPCGFLGDRKNRCRCTPAQIQRYRSKISGPLLDRIDIHVEAAALSIDEVAKSAPGETSAQMRGRVMRAREIQSERFSGLAGTTRNSDMSPRQIKRHCGLDAEQQSILTAAMEELNLSARAYDRILKVSRTIADLAESDKIQTEHLLEAINYRTLDRGF